MTTLISEQKQATQEIAQAIAHQRVSHAYLLTGADQLQTHQLGIWFCQALFCQHSQAGYPCLKCNHCRRIAQGDFPDVVSLQTDKKSLGVDDIRALKLEMGQSGIESNHRACLIKDAQKLTIAAENSLLKFLEDPAGPVTTILLAETTSAFLPTILSRVQIIQLTANGDQSLAQNLQAQGYSANDIELIQRLHLENLLLEGMSAAHFAKVKAQARSWFELVLTKPQQAFVSVAASVLPLIDNQVQQQIFMSLLEGQFSQYLNQQVTQARSLVRARRLTEQFLHAQRLWQANVSFENCLEQLALKVDFISKGS
ncbi:hypothetical protein [Bombilactobacillus bombi]|uniref:hypothetical protein n=1 Tax=Bombilactobacillus bombi TaxID=1303590 RepID=UPI0015E5C6C4|nr:hypothetical protein [Bombilactobacillus bombi]MBA1434403.1 hypothetical protein [Bombilactobacillus bombi]